jgi:hypothetical protein
MPNYATNADLQKLLPDILDHGVADFTDQLTLATADVLELIKVDWFREAANDYYGYTAGYKRGTYFPTLDEAYLDTSNLVNLTCYRALARYIFPMLTKDADFDAQDAYAIKMDRYQAYFEDEWKVVQRMPLYDFDKDSAFEDVERHDQRGRRVVRA